MLCFSVTLNSSYFSTVACPYARDFYFKIRGERASERNNPETEAMVF